MSMPTPTREEPQLGPAERDHVFGVCLKMLKNPDAAEDATQETLLLAHRHRDKFRGESRFTTWLHSIAATTALMHLRRERRRLPVYGGMDADARVAAVADCDLTPEGVVHELELREMVRQTWARLGVNGPATRLKLDGYGDVEIAQMLDMPVATAKTQWSRGVARLRCAILTGQVAQPAHSREVRQALRVLRRPRRQG